LAFGSAAPVLRLGILLLALYLPARMLLSRQLRDRTALERVCASFAASAFAIYFVHMTGSAFHWSFASCQRVLLVLLGAGLLIVSRAIGAEVRSIVDSGEWLYLAAVAGAAMWLLLLVVAQGNLSGGGWMGDWWEHYQRMLFFLRDSDPYATHGFDVTARPPAFNIVAATLADLTGSRFSDYQIIHTALASLTLLPALLLLQHFRGPQPPGPAMRFGALLFCFTLVLQPMFATNAVYPWSRMFTSFFALSGMYGYLVGALPAAFLCLGVAMVSHYSAGVLALVFAADCLWRSKRISQRLSVLLLGVPLLPWAVWASRTYGVGPWLTSNTAVQNFLGHHVLEVVQQWLYNVETTFVPFARFADMGPFIAQTSRLGTLYDALHLYWASNFWGSLSTALTGTAAVFLLFGRDHRAAIPQAGRRLFALSAVAIGLSFVVVPNVEVSGISHLTLQPVVIALFALGYAAICELPSWLRRGFVLFFLVEAWSFYILKTFTRDQLMPELYSIGYRINLSFKESQHVQFLYDEYPLLARAVPIALISLLPLLYGSLYVGAFERVGRRRPSA